MYLTLEPLLRPHLYQGARARIDRSNTTGDGVQAAVAAASVEDGAEVCAAGWIAAQRGRATSRRVSGGSTPRSQRANAGGSGAIAAQQIQDLNVVVVGMLDREKVLKERLKAMDNRANGRTLDLHKLCFAALDAAPAGQNPAKKGWAEQYIVPRRHAP